ncbi:hypothetical protein L3Y34_011452 [Caenorhabditis briggsae]|uniref:Uncharacterized protein n=1 Tax=Caenorhabditis briggsae TaxID=6238 RepID=A0AAE9CUG4_CAEBR|nr:hypothetical protein L3Y34_011452 [Caenorhabditis briggsae]
MSTVESKSSGSLDVVRSFLFIMELKSVTGAKRCLRILVFQRAQINLKEILNCEKWTPQATNEESRKKVTRRCGENEIDQLTRGGEDREGPSCEHVSYGWGEQNALGKCEVVEKKLKAKLKNIQRDMPKLWKKVRKAHEKNVNNAIWYASKLTRRVKVMDRVKKKQKETSRRLHLLRMELLEQQRNGVSMQCLMLRISENF